MFEISFQDYFSDCTETIIKENYVVVYEVGMTFHKTLKYFTFIYVFCTIL